MAPAPASSADAGGATAGEQRAGLDVSLFIASTSHDASQARADASAGPQLCLVTRGGGEQRPPIKLPLPTRSELTSALAQCASAEGAPCKQVTAYQHARSRAPREAAYQDEQSRAPRQAAYQDEQSRAPRQAAGMEVH